MSGHQFAAIGCRLIGIYALIHAASTLPAVIASLSGAGLDAVFLFSVLLGAAVWWAAAILLLLAPQSLVGAVGGTAAESTSEPSMAERSPNPAAANDLGAMLFRAAGLLLIVLAVSDTQAVHLTLSYLLEDVQFQGSSATYTVGLTLQLVAKLVVGTVLVFGAAGLSGLIGRLRKAGQESA